MGILRRGKKDDKEEDYIRTQALTEQGRPGADSLEQDLVYSLGRSIYMIHDPNFADKFQRDKQLQNSYPAFSMINRTSNIGKLDAELLLLDYEYLVLLNELNMKEEDYEKGGWAKMESLRIFARYMVADAFNGWKGKLVTEQVKIIRTELEKKKKGLLPF